MSKMCLFHHPKTHEEFKIKVDELMYFKKIKDKMGELMTANMLKCPMCGSDSWKEFNNG